MRQSRKAATSRHTADPRDFVLNVLGADGEFVLARTTREGNRCLLVAPADPHAPPAGLRRLENAYRLREKLPDGATTRPLELIHFQNQPALLLEDVGGEVLETLLGERWETSAYLRIAQGLASAIAEFHLCGLLHQDIRPVNILADLPTGRVWLTGLGATSEINENHAPQPVEPIRGALPYIAPERTGRMNRPVSARSDLYSVGIVFYRMLTGELPLRASDPAGWIHAHLARAPAPPTHLVPDLPEMLAEIVMKLVTKRAEDRYQSAAGLARDLQRCRDEWEATGTITPFPLGERDAPGRLVTPGRLYGRSEELRTLMDAAGRVAASGTLEFLLVSGYSGVGKSSLVYEMQRNPAFHGLFADGKFEQSQRDVPYATLTQSFASLLRQILAGADAEIDQWKTILHEALESSGKLIADLIPELEVLLGTQPPVPDLPPQEARNRFHRIFRRFLAAFARPENPLTLFLDDLQWADPATLELLQHLVVNRDVPHLLLIGAYRDNEVDSSHPLAQAVGAIEKEGIALRTVALPPLAFGELAQLIGDSLQVDPADAHPLIELLHEKTRGNPFFAIQFLAELEADGLLAFDFARHSWQWDADRVAAKNFTDNVVTFMEGRLGRLPTLGRETVTIFACLGNHASTRALAVAQAVTEEETHAALSVAVREGLIVRRDDGYDFLHDRVQEAAYERLPVAERAGAHLQIGRRLARHLAEENVFEVVNQFNHGVALISDPAEREKLAGLNLAAGRRSIASTAYTSARRYLGTAATLLDEASWEHAYSLIFDVERHLAQCEFLTGDLEEADRRLSALSLRARDTVDHSLVACLHIEVCTAKNGSDRAVEICLRYLRQVGIDWTPHPSKERFREEYDSFQQNLADRPIESLVDLQSMSDPVQRATLNVLSAVGPAAFFTDENLLNLTLGRTANISLIFGNDDSSPLAYTYLGSILGPQFADYETGFRLGKLGIDLVERGLDRWKCRVYVCFGTLISPWSKPVRASFDLIRKAFEAALEVGDLGYAGYCCQNLIPLLLANGTSLAEVHREASERLEFARKIKFDLVIDSLTGQLALIRQLRGFTRDFSSFDDGEFNEAVFERHLTADPLLAFPACWYWIRKLQGRFFAGDYSAAIDAAEKAAPLLWTSPSFIEIAEYHFFSALALAAIWDHAGEKEQRRQALAVHHAKLDSWAKNCPKNFANRVELVAAEIARIEYRELDAERSYENAIRLAHEAGFAHHEALACELAAGFHEQRGFEIISQAYRERARMGYLAWGADGKVRDLERTGAPRPTILESGANPTTTGGFVNQLDLATVFKMSHAASEEIVLQRLIERLLVTTIEHAAAERGLLLMKNDERLRIVAEGTSGGDEVRVALRDDPPTSHDLPVSVASYVARTQETLVLGDASRAHPFLADEYFARTVSRSVLCLPLVKQGRMVGIVYLENRLVAHAFSQAQVDVLRLVSSQAAISLENAGLYSDLRRSEAYLARAQNLSNTGSFGWKPGTSEVVWSEQTFRILGFDLTTQPDFSLALARVHPEDVNYVTEALDDAVRDKAQFDFQARLRMPNGEIKEVRCIGKPVPDEAGKVREFIGALQDISAEKQAEKTIRSVQAELVEASDRERRNVGRDLHDGLGQQLTALALMSDALCEKASRQRNGGALADDARQIGVYLREAIGETRRLAHGLAPVPFAGDGLTSALEALVKSIDATGSVRAEFQCDGLIAFDESAVTEHLYRIVQEAVNNALKHSAATFIRVTLGTRENSVEISIADNGSGFSRTPPEELGMGLRAMSYRANLVGGKLVATNGANGGALITCTLPLPLSSAGDA